LDDPPDATRNQTQRATFKGLMSSTRIAVLGAGMAGLAAANTLRDQDCKVFEARSHSGGHASTFRVGTYHFDEGPHVSFTSNERVRKFLAASVGGRFNTHPTYATNFYDGHIVRHPVQCNLRGLPTDLVSKCIASFVQAQYGDKKEINNYRDWCYAGLGEVISETFTRLYTRKYWTLEMEQLTTDWVSARVYAPKLEEVLDGALSEASGQHYYMSKFHYPQDNGFGEYNTLLTERSRVEYGRKASEINPLLRKVTFESGDSIHYEHLISSIPLPELLNRIPTAPAAVREAAAKLTCSSHLLVSVGVKRPLLNDAYWMYVYDEDIPFSRISFPSKYSGKIAPQGYSSAQVEIVHSKYKALPAHESIADLTVEGLIRCGILHNKEEIDVLDIRDIRYANVVFDFDRKRNLGIVHDYLREVKIHWCGRYGDWEYHWTDQSMLSGERAANEIRALIGEEAKEYTEGVV